MAEEPCRRPRRGRVGRPVGRRETAGCDHMCGRFVSNGRSSGVVRGCRCYGVVPTFLRYADTITAMLVRQNGRIRPHTPVNCEGFFGFGGFPTLILWTTQVRGNKLCEGIVRVTPKYSRNHLHNFLTSGVSRCITRAHENDPPKTQ